MVDRTCLIAQMFDNFIAQHPAADHLKLRKRIKHIEDGLYQLYNDASILHGRIP